MWALISYKNKLPQNIFPTVALPEKERDVFNHSYYQGLLVEIGNLKKFETFIPNQDKNKKILDKTLGDISSQNTFYQFGYNNIVNRAKTIDVCWFNVRKMPYDFFEVEHSTDIYNSLLKFTELQDYNANFFIVADRVRKNEYESKLGQSAFMPIKSRVQFMDYDKLSDLHAKASEIAILEKNLNL